MSIYHEDILGAFETFQQTLDKEQALREKIRETVLELDQLVTKAVTTLQKIHLEETGIYNRILDQAKAYLNGCSVVNMKLGEIVTKNYYKYHDQWKFTTQKAVFCITLITFLQSQKLASKSIVAHALSLKIDPRDGFHLDLEDYLHGLLQLVSELSRLAVNSAACGNYTWPVAISKFVNELNAGFRLMNFKNDSLRKHYDCFKYDLKKVEEVVYDLSIRGLKSKAPNELEKAKDTTEVSETADSSSAD